MKRKIILALVMLIFTFRGFAVTVMKDVGHGDCYVIISDGRVVVIDVGPSNADGLIDLLKSGRLHYDRIIITHVHSDHAGGLVSAERYAKEAKHTLTADLFVSNHGVHDLDLIVKDRKVPEVLDAMRGTKPVAALTDKAIARLAMEDPHLRVEAINLKRGSRKSENRTGLIIKVTEIRDGVSRATLFLGDIEAAQQRALFEHPKTAQIFENVRAVTLPHHGRKTTLLPDFFRRLKETAGPGVVVLHSDAMQPDADVQAWARQEGINIRSTASSPGEDSSDVYLELYETPTFLLVSEPTTIDTLSLQSTGLPITLPANISTQELAGAISEFSQLTSSQVLPKGYILSLPTTRGVSDYSSVFRNRLISDLQSRTASTRDAAARSLSSLARSLSREQIERIIDAMRNGTQSVDTRSWRGPHCTHYEDTAAKYYVGRLLETLDSPYITEDVRTEARRAQTTAISQRRVDDPGWI